MYRENNKDKDNETFVNHKNYFEMRFCLHFSCESFALSFYSLEVIIGNKSSPGDQNFNLKKLFKVLYYV